MPSPITYSLDINDFFTAPDTKKSKKEPETKIFFDAKKIPHKVEFYRPENSLWCWHDHHPLTLEGEVHNPGYSLPINQKGGIARFCSYECMLAYSNMETRPLTRSSASLVTEMFSRDHPGEDLSSLKQAAPFEALIEYGGNLTIQEYRTHFHRPKKSNIFSVLSQGMEIRS